MHIPKTDPLVLFLAGLGTGVAAALLFTLNSGRDTRERIGTLANRTGEAAKELAGEAKAAIRDTVEHASKAAERLADEAANLVPGIGRKLEDSGLASSGTMTTDFRLP